jgi:pyridoxine 5'-phosphate synthase PdxJ
LSQVDMVAVLRGHRKIYKPDSLTVAKR